MEISQADVDKCLRIIGTEKRTVASDLDKILKTMRMRFGKRGISAHDLDMLFKKLSVGKRQEAAVGNLKNMCDDCNMEKKSFASFRWRLAGGNFF